MFVSFLLKLNFCAAYSNMLSASDGGSKEFDAGCAFFCWILLMAYFLMILQFSPYRNSTRKWNLKCERKTKSEKSWCRN